VASHCLAKISASKLTILLGTLRWAWMVKQDSYSLSLKEGQSKARNTFQDQGQSPFSVKLFFALFGLYCCPMLVDGWIPERKRLTVNDNGAPAEKGNGKERCSLLTLKALEMCRCMVPHVFSLSGWRKVSFFQHCSNLPMVSSLLGPECWDVTARNRKCWH